MSTKIFCFLENSPTSFEELQAAIKAAKLPIILKAKGSISSHSGVVPASVRRRSANVDLLLDNLEAFDGLAACVADKVHKDSEVLCLLCHGETIDLSCALGVCAALIKEFGALVYDDCSSSFMSLESILSEFKKLSKVDPDEEVASLHSEPISELKERRKNFLSLVSDNLKNLAFKKKGTKWLMDTPESQITLSLQEFSSRFRYCLNSKIKYKDSEFDFDVAFRHNLGWNLSNTDEYLSVMKDLPSVLSTNVIPFLLSVSSVNGPGWHQFPERVIFAGHSPYLREKRPEQFR